jgi:UDP-glucose 4-epimerase
VAKHLVTGGAGFIGSHIVRALARDHEVVVLDDLSTGRRENLAGLPVTVIEADIRDREALARACAGVDAVFHLAARISVAASMEDPVDTVEVNTLGTLALVEACRAARVRAIVLSSSAAVYGDSPRLPKRESMRLEPRSPYAVSKLDGEHYLEIFAAPAGIRAVALRYFNVFGPGQAPDSQYAAAIPAIASRALAGREITIFGDGRQTRDFVYVDDIVRANLMAAGVIATAGSRPVAGAYNVGGGRAITILALAREIVRVTGSLSPIVHADSRPGDVRHSRADVSRIRRDLGFAARVPLREGLEATIRALRDRR